MAQGQTYIGDLKARIDVPAHGQTADGMHRVFMNFVPNDRFDERATFGTYKYWKVKPFEWSTREVHEWSHFSTMTDKWEDAGPREGNLCFPQGLQWGIELAAQEFDCNVWMEFRLEYLDPADHKASALYLNLHVFGLKEMQDLNRFVQAFASRINREARRWARESVHWSVECI